VTATLSPEQRLLAACIGQPFGIACLAQPESPRDTRLNWEVAADLASQHGLAPLVYAGLVKLDVAAPMEFHERLRAQSLGALVRSEAWIEPSLAAVLDVLQSHGLAPIVLKGAALAYTAYPEPAQRTFSDIDLLLPEEEVCRASGVLRERGFSLDDRAKAPEHHLAVHYVPDAPVGVELHCHLLPRPHPYAICLEQLRSRSRMARVAGVEARVLAPSDALLVACLHLSYTHRYRWFLLRALTDVLAITASNAKNVDWEGFFETVQRSRASGAVFWPLQLSRRWLDAPIPAWVLSGLAPSTMRRTLVNAVAEPCYLLDDEVPEGSGVLYQLLLELSLYQGCSLGTQVRSVLRCLFPPPEAVGHLSARLTRSRVRYAFHLGRPSRLARGIISLGRLILRLARENRRA